MKPMRLYKTVRLGITRWSKPVILRVDTSVVALLNGHNKLTVNQVNYVIAKINNNRQQVQPGYDTK